MKKIFDTVRDLKTRRLELQRKKDEIEDETIQVISDFGDILSEGLDMELLFYDGIAPVRDEVSYSFSGENAYCEIMVDFSNLTLNSVKCDDTKDERKVLAFFSRELDK